MSGGSGTWLKILYKNAGVDVADVSIIGTTQCKLPASLTKDEQFQAIEHCRKNYVQPFLESRPWKRVDLFGDAPLKHIAEKEGGVDRWRGSSIAVGAPEVCGDAPNCIPTFSPAYIMRDQSMVPVVINDLRKTPEVEPEHYNIYPSLDDIRNFKYKSFAFDIETNRWDNTQIYMVGLSGKAFEAIVVPFSGEFKEELKRIFAEAEEVIGQNCIQFDLPILAKQGVTIRGPRECKVWDIMLMHHLRFPSFPHGLEFIGKQFTSKGAWKYDKVSFETYCARDVDVTFRCFAPLKGLLEQAKVLDIYRYVSWPLALICKSMTDWGFKRSTSRVKELRLKYFKAIEDEQPNLPEHLRTIQVAKRKRSPAPPGTVNDKGKPVKFVYDEVFEEKRPWKSPAVKMKFLYDECGLPPQLHVKKKTPTVDKTALDKLFNRLNNPAQALLKQFGEARIAELKKVVKSLKDLNQWATRLAGFAKDSEEVDDFIHSSFNVHGTETGRLSSSGGDGVAGNMQNIPEEARFMFVPRFEGGRIVALDYSGGENRLTARIANDTRRQKWFEDRKFSEHKYLAAQLEGVPYEEVVKSKDKDSWYAIAKVVVHGVDRLMGAKRIWENNDLDPESVKKVHAQWKNQIIDTVHWQRKAADEAKRIGWACNAFGRKLWFWESNAATRAISFYPQSTLSDIVARAMIGLMYERIGWPEEWAQKVSPVLRPLPEGAYLVLQVHDELVFETVSEEMVAPTIEAAQTVMEQPWQELGGLSLPAGIAHGESWGECN